MSLWTILLPVPLLDYLEVGGKVLRGLIVLAKLGGAEAQAVVGHGHGAALRRRPGV